MAKATASTEPPQKYLRLDILIFLPLDGRRFSI
jgi:hypothetical protein